MIEYSSYRIIGKKPRLVIVDENGNIINKNPSKEELKGLEEEPYKVNTKKEYTDSELLNYLKIFYDKNKRIPTRRDFENNSKYPGCNTYVRHFGGWNDALKLLGLDIDTTTKQNILQSTNHKGRLFEIRVIDAFTNKPIDLSGDNHGSPCDGICPNGKIYDAKSARLYEDKYWPFIIKNKYKEEIELFYLGAFNKYYTELLYVWRIPGEIVEDNYFYVGIRNNYKFNIENMAKYDITDKFKNLPNIVVAKI